MSDGEYKDKARVAALIDMFDKTDLFTIGGSPLLPEFSYFNGNWENESPDDEVFVFSYEEGGEDYSIGITGHMLENAKPFNEYSNHIELPGEFGGFFKIELFTLTPAIPSLVPNAGVRSAVAESDPVIKRPDLLHVVLGNNNHEAYALDDGDGFKLLVTIDHDNHEDPEGIGSHLPMLANKMGGQVFRVELDQPENGFHWDDVLNEAVARHNLDLARDATKEVNEQPAINSPKPF